MIFIKRKNKKKEILNNEVFVNLVKNMQIIPEGSFLMGSNMGEDDERPIHNVFIRDFYLSRFTITQKEWIAFEKSSPWEKCPNIKDGEDYPVVNINWYDANGFIDKINTQFKGLFR